MRTTKKLQRKRMRKRVEAFCLAAVLAVSGLMQPTGEKKAEAATATRIISRNLKKAGVIPSAYNKDHSKNCTPVKGSRQECNHGVYAQIATMESSLLATGLAKETVDLSEGHLQQFASHPTLLSKKTGDDQKKSEIGASIAALGRWEGPVNESDYPTYYNEDDGVLAVRSLMESDRYKSAYHVKEIVNLTNESEEAKKKAIMQYGGLLVSYCDKNFPGGYMSFYFTEKVVSYFSDTTDAANMSVEIVGWDDNYRSNDFKPTKTDRPGAWLCKYSHGSVYGESGYGWISYYTPSLTDFYCFKMADKKEYDYKKAYDEYDSSSFARKLSANQKTLYMANVFGTSEDKRLSAVSFVTLNKKIDCSVKVYASKEEMQTGRFLNSNRELVSSVPERTYQQGFHTVQLPKELDLSEYEQYLVVIIMEHSSERIVLPIDTSQENHRVGEEYSYYAEKDEKAEDWSCDYNGVYPIHAILVNSSRPERVETTETSDDTKSDDTEDETCTEDAKAMYLDQGLSTVATAGTIYVNGGKVGPKSGTKVDYKSQVYYPNIAASNIVTTDAKGKEKSKAGKLVVVTTKDTTEPTISNGKVTNQDKSLEKIAKGTYSKGKLTVKAGNTAGTVYVWVVDTGDKKASSYIRVNVLTAPKKVQLSNSNKEFAKANILKKILLPVNSTSENIYIHPTLGKGDEEVKDASYTVMPDDKSKDYITIMQDEKNENAFQIKAVKMNTAKAGKKMSCKVTAMCNENGKKVNVTVIVYNPIEELKLVGESNKECVATEAAVTNDNIVPGSVVIARPEGKIASVLTLKPEMACSSADFETTDTLNVKLMPTTDGYKIDEKGKITVNKVTDAEQKNYKVSYAKKTGLITVSLKPHKVAKGAEDDKTYASVYLLVYAKTEGGTGAVCVYEVKCQ